MLLGLKDFGKRAIQFVNVDRAEGRAADVGHERDFGFAIAVEIRGAVRQIAIGQGADF